jgi:hypothetical protein
MPQIRNPQGRTADLEKKVSATLGLGADSSPLIILAKLGCFHLLNRVFSGLYISSEVHHEVVVAGVGLPGASEVANAEWTIQSKLSPKSVSWRYKVCRARVAGPARRCTIIVYTQFV